MAHSDTWSTKTNHPSVKSSSHSKTSKEKVESQSRSKSSSPDHETQDTSPSQSIDEGCSSFGRASRYAADPINPNPGYEHWSAKESMEAHTVDMRQYLERYDDAWSHASQ
ncbi:uncharacterized protein EAF01_002733 [Botrytis porri]|uniref:Uncharacterized protein n=1 Tax=Botrytis porri TaxID=87229 RepID=A0A4Z1KX07_9HELO|nr:uncharacterized protein EAF01_002733 [Botrytis porri]KAF7911225.1 hypothetical protein EAF01_002733 [Botrytis porri]TGO89074.1 hypothetical protein BPOR_0126g00050 [Botrytis porri]